MRKLQWILHGEKDSLNALGEMKLVPLTLSEPSRRSLPIPCNNQISCMENSTCVLTHEALWASSPLTGHGTLPRASLVNMVEIPGPKSSSPHLDCLPMDCSFPRRAQLCYQPGASPAKPALCPRRRPGEILASEIGDAQYTCRRRGKEGQTHEGDGEGLRDRIPINALIFFRRKVNIGLGEASSGSH